MPPTTIPIFIDAKADSTALNKLKKPVERDRGSLLLCHFHIYKTNMQPAGTRRRPGSGRMNNALQYAFSQPKRETKKFEVDPRWQQRLNSANGKKPSTVFKPTASPGMNQAGNGGYRSGGMGNPNRSGRKAVGKNAFDAKAFLAQQRKGEYLHRNSSQKNSNAQPQRSGKFSVHPAYSQQRDTMTIAQATKSFDIEKFKATQPKKKVLKPPNTNRRKQTKRVQIQDQASSEKAQSEQNVTTEDSLPWQNADRKYAARAAQGKSSKEFLQQFSANQTKAASKTNESVDANKSAPEPADENSLDERNTQEDAKKETVEVGDNTTVSEIAVP